METTLRPFRQISRALALATVFGAGFTALHAQTATPTLDLTTPSTTAAATPQYSSSAPSEDQLAMNTPRLNLSGINAFQYGGRRREGRPRYRGGNTNADGSSKYGFFADVGLTLPTQDTETYNTPSWAYGVGFIRNFNRHAGVQIEFNYDNFGLKGSTLANQTNLYNYNVPPIYQVAGLDGSSHVWSFSINPTYKFYSGEGMGAYVIGGAGFYHKVTDFTVPVSGTAYDPYYGYYNYTANQIIDHYSSNAPGLDGGIGLTYKFSRFSNQELFAEGRYVYIFNPYRPGYTSANVTTTTYNGPNDYPANSLRTSYFPVKFGIRF